MRIIFAVFVFSMILACQPSDTSPKNTFTPTITPDDVLDPVENEKRNQTNPNRTAQEKATVNLNEIINDGFQIVQHDRGMNISQVDLNSDGNKDIIALVKKEDDTRIRIYESDGQGNYSLRTQTGNLGSHFTHNNDNPQLSMDKSVSSHMVFLATHQSMRHDYILKFRFDDTANDYRLIGSELNNYGNAFHDGAGNISTNFLTGQCIKSLMAYDETKGETSTLPKQTIEISKTPLFLSDINDDNIYELISGE